ncbi:hypothetical protein HK405_009049, partial [Cladochytrium tenue]
MPHGARFIFELLQNCDDNNYNKCRASNVQPFVSFDVHSDRIVVECNEDGFTEENITSISAVGESSKVGASCYTGEKGIGFKSVFIVAYKVLIQSGIFCFFFQHKPDEAGMGMITPIWEDSPEGYPADGVTRITLFLRTDGDEKARLQVVHDQLLEIHDAILLFMRNIESIRVTFHGGNDPLEIRHSIKDEGHKQVKVLKHELSSGNESVKEKLFTVIKYIATGLAKSENRKYSEEDEELKTYSKSEVVLAFPQNDAETPDIENQWIFAFLPIRQSGFK